MAWRKKTRKAFKILSLIPDVIYFITTAIEALKDRELTALEIADLIEAGSDLLEEIT
jgi:hypothetical protein